MKETIISNAEREFILKSLANEKRIDGREIYDMRKIKFHFGSTFGHVEVQLGNTRVLVQVSCEVSVPLPNKPTEGFILFNCQLSPMAAPKFEVGRPSDENTEFSRIIDRCFRESRVIETEGLCIVAGEKVWSVRVDIHVLDHGGNFIDCACIATAAALRHFRRPDISISGEEVTIHKLEDRPPVPLSLHHMPLCVTTAFFEAGKYLVVDPLLDEENVMDGRLIMSMNIHKEVCAIQHGGGVPLKTEQIMRCTEIAFVKVQEMTELIEKALEEATGEKRSKLPELEDKQKSIGKNIKTVTESTTPVNVVEKVMDIQETLEREAQEAEEKNAMDIDDEKASESDSEEEETVTL